MDQVRILASVVFPFRPIRRAGLQRSFGPELGSACIQAYNDWMID